MKTFKNIAVRFGGLLLIVCMAIGCTLAFSSCTTEEDELDDDGHRAFSKAFDFSVTHVERVGSVLVMDFTIRNKSGKDIQRFKIRPSVAEDSNGKRYVNDAGGDLHIRLGNGEYAYDRTTAFAKGATLTGTFKVSLESSSIRTINLKFRCEAEEANLDPYEEIATGNQNIIDNRVVINGIQTNDLGLKYDLVKTEQVGKEVYITFRLTNNTGEVLTDFSLRPNHAYDQNGESYSTYIVAGNGTNYSYDVTTNINKNASQTYTIKANYVERKVSNMTMDVSVTSPSYVVADNILRIISVSIPFGNIEEPEAKLLKGIGNKVAFKYDSNDRLTGIGYNGNDYSTFFSYNPFSIAFGKSSTMISGFVFDSNGYVTGFKGNSSTTSHEQTVNYDSDGHIIGFTQKWYNNGELSSYVEVSITWVNGNVARYEDVWYRSDGTVYSQEIGIPMYSGIENKARQISLSQVLLVGDLMYYNSTGVFGDNCSRLLPDAVTVTEYKNGAIESVETTTYSYEFNADGTIYKETENGTPYIYSYY